MFHKPRKFVVEDVTNLYSACVGHSLLVMVKKCVSEAELTSRLYF
jgi:hypothetical protein